MSDWDLLYPEHPIYGNVQQNFLLFPCLMYEKNIFGIGRPYFSEVKEAWNY